MQKQRQVAHRDIKPQNIFLQSKDSHSAIKIGDFGFAKRVYTPKSLTSRCGTPSYVAPEILKNQPYDQSCDMWSVGVVLYVMLCGYTPFLEENQEKMFDRIKLGDWKFDKQDWSHVSPEAKDLIKHLMNTNVDKRMTAARALKSKWISTMTDKQLSSNDLSQSMRNLKISKPKFKDLGVVFTAFQTTGKKAKKGLSAVASSTLASTQHAFKSASSSIDKSEKSAKHDLV
jgi:calcium/calmodulin-dependent protein kinase I